MKTVKIKLKKFFVQSFYPRGKSDYAEIFTRGLKNTDGANNVYPWFYLRVFAISGALFTAFAIIYSLMSSRGYSPVFYVTGGAVLDAAFLVLLYELYPEKDFSLFKLAAITLAGGTAAVLLSSLMYLFHDREILLNGWKLAAIAGVGEEITKGVPVIICIALLKKKDSPLSGFLIGAAVGTAFSVTENASYILNSGLDSYKILTAVVRAFGCMFSHAVWSALIGWAYCKFDKPFLNIRFYATVLFCMATHFCIDMPLWDHIAVLFAEAAVCGLATFIFGAVVIYRERRKILSPADAEDLCDATVYIPNVTAAAFGTALCILLLLLCAVFSRTSYIKTEYRTREDIITFMQLGLDISPDADREYDPEYPTSLALYQNGVLTLAEQRVEGGGFTYVYRYSLNEKQTAEDGEFDNAEPPNEEKEFLLVSTDVITVEDGEEQRIRLQTFTDGENEISFYPLNGEAAGGKIKFVNGSPVYYEKVDRPSALSIALIAVCPLIAVSGAAAYVVTLKKYKTRNN